MRRVGYKQTYDGEPYHPKPIEYVACCGCGLVHRLRLRIVRGKIEATVWVDRRKTAARRRGKRFAHLRKVKWPRIEG